MIFSLPETYSFMEPIMKSRVLSGALRSLISLIPDETFLSAGAAPLRPQNLSRQLLGGTDVFGTIGFSTTVAAYNSRLVTEAFDALFVILCL